jgi:phage repressor protein C with HTH and peptisase S24 domain
VKVGRDLLKHDSTPGERLRDARKKAGYSSAAKAADAMGITSSTYAGHENGQNEFDRDQAIAYGRKFKVSPAFLMFGTATNGERTFATFDPDAPDQIDEVEMTAGSLTGNRGIPDDSSAQLDVTGGMGGGGFTTVAEGVPGKHGMTFAAEFVSDYWRIPPAVLSALGLKAADITFIPVQGDSMQPTLFEGDVVVVDTRHRWPSPDGVYALVDAFGGIVVKRLSTDMKPDDPDAIVEITSDNPRHRPKEMRLDEIRIIGRVLRKFGLVQ